MPQSFVSPVTVNGPVNAVPCAHCGQKLDLSELQEEGAIERGVSIECDHCKRNSEIVDIRKVVVLRQA